MQPQPMHYYRAHWIDMNGTTYAEKLFGAEGYSEAVQAALGMSQVVWDGEVVTVFPSDVVVERE